MFSTDFKKGDYSHTASYFTEDAIYMPAGQETIKGRKAIERYWHDTRDHGVKEFRIKVERVEASGNMAYEIGNATARIRKTSDGEEVADSVRYLVVWRQESDGVWRILADVSNRSQGQTS